MQLRRLGLLGASIALGLSALAGEPVQATLAAPAPLIAIDPGHGGDDYGTSGVGAGKRMLEKEITLTVARQTSAYLSQAGYKTLLLRTDDGAVNKGVDRTGDGKIDLADELQARVDRANDAGATVLVSIHFNGSTDRSLRGTEVYYSAARPFAAENRKLADGVLAAVNSRLKDAGRAVTPRGVLRDSVLGGGSLFLLGPAGGRIARSSNMPGILIEGMFLTNADDATLLADPATLQALARGYADGIAGYVGPPPKPQPKRAQVVGEAGAYLRPSPLVAAEPLTLLDPGTTVDLAEQASGDEVGGSSDWWRVTVKGKAGYVFAALLEPVTAASAPQTPAAPPRVTVRDDDGRAARLRSDPKLDSPIVARAKVGETLDVLDAADGDVVDGKSARWLKVKRANGDIGWVWAPLVDG